MPYKLFRFERIVAPCRASRSKLNNEAYFKPNTARPDIRQSVRFKPRLATGSSIRSKLSRTRRSNPGALKVLRKNGLAMLHHPTY